MICPMTLATLLEDWCEAPPELTVDGISMDSQRVRPGDAFIAVAGATTHGMVFAADAQDRGARVVIHDGLAPLRQLDIPLVKIDGLGQLLPRLAARFFHCPSDRLTIAGITGTNGKTSTAHFIAQAWHRTNGKAGLIGTLGYGALSALAPAQLTTPDPVSVQRMLAECIDNGVENVAMEVSSHALEQGRCAEIAFAAAALSNAGIRPAARLALSYQNPEQGWIVFSPLGTAAQLLSPDETDSQVANYKSPDLAIWQITSALVDEELTWYLAGTLPEPRSVPLTLALVLERHAPQMAEEIGQAILSAALGP